MSQVINVKKVAMMRLLLLVLLTIGCLVQAAERHVKSVNLFRADAKEVAKLIKPLLSKDAVVVPYSNYIVLSVTDDEFERITALVNKLDIPPYQLMISVRTQGHKSRGRSTGLDGVIGSEGQIQRRIIISAGSSKSAHHGEQTISVREASPAYISAGRAVPVKKKIFDDNGRYRTKFKYRLAEQGFYVMAKIHGDQVALDIHYADDRVGRDGASFDRRTVDTQITGKVGEWLTISRSSREVSGQRIGFNMRQYSTVDSVYDVLVKVDVLD